MTTPWINQWHRQALVYDGVRMGYTAAQLARYLGVSATTVRRDIAALAAWPLRGDASKRRNVCRPCEQTARDRL